MCNSTATSLLCWGSIFSSTFFSTQQRFLLALVGMEQRRNNIFGIIEWEPGTLETRLDEAHIAAQISDVKVGCPG